MECVIWGERSLLMQFSIKVKYVTLLNHGPRRIKIIAGKRCVANTAEHGLFHTLPV